MTIFSFRLLLLLRLLVATILWEKPAAAMFEAVLADVPVVCVGREVGLEMPPIWDNFCNSLVESHT